MNAVLDPAPPVALPRILAIEDDPRIGASLVDILKYSGFDAFHAINGAVGLAQARELLPDLILCDVMMPEMTGLDVLRALKAEPHTAAIPFIFLTARVERTNVREGMDLGADDYITKPFIASELIASIEARLKKSTELTRKVEDVRISVVQAVPHEFFTPLNAILGFSELILHGLEAGGEVDREETLDSVRHIRDAGERLLHITHSYTLYANLTVALSDPKTCARLRASQTVLTSEELHAQLLELAGHHQRVKEVRVHLQPATVRAGQDYLRPLLRELLDNALKFSPAGSPIDVLGELKDGGYEFAIVDRGRGMSGEQLQRLGGLVQFDRSRQAQSGLGLGLSIARLIAEVHGGRFAVESELGKGVRVRVWLPLATADETSKR